MAHERLNSYFSSIVETMHDGLMVVGPDGNIMMVNQSLERMSGYDREALVGQTCSILHCDACEMIRRRPRKGGAWCSLFEDPVGRKERCRCDIITRSGALLPVLKNAAVLRDDRGAPLGAVETITDITELVSRDRRIEDLSRRLADQTDFCGMIGRSPALRRVFALIRKAAASEAAVIIYGESGTGKELVARAIHDLSERSQGPFIQLNCAAMSESLFESEVFGHVKGAFTGAYRHRPGRFEVAHGGSIFLDEIGEMPPSTQVKLLRVLETKQIERVGDHRPIQVDIRVIAATNRDLVDLVRRGLFREDLFFRINVIPIHIPPLRDRLDDLPALVEAEVEELRLRTGKPITGLAPTAFARLAAYDWPGNVRELKSALHYAFVVAESGQIQLEHLPEILQAKVMVVRPAGDHADQKAAILAALKQTGGNQTQAARLLGITRTTLWHRMKRSGLELNKTISS